MNELLSFAYRISRPRFWGYLAGPYAIGYVIGVRTQSDFLNLLFFLHLFYFSIIANILVYGINDYFDTDTDMHNLKKKTYEHKLFPKEKRNLVLLLALSLLFSFGMLLFQKTIESAVFFSTFIFLSIFYSSPPLRFKSRPFLDSSSNILYAMPAFLAYNQVTGQLPSVQIVIAALCWTAAMHLFSAIPDIVPDKKAGITTTAVYLGLRKSLLLCAALWSACALISVTIPQLFPWSLLAFIYPALPLYVLKNNHILNKVYWRFPYITMGLGAALFFIFFFSKPYA